MSLRRPLLTFLREVLETDRKMVFLSGPRQVGKTTLAERLRESYGQGLSLNWDKITDQKKIIQSPYFFENAPRDPDKPFLLIFDEIHKYARWKNYLKGAFDSYRDQFFFLVTGSGRLDVFKRGGDSLLGRYFGVPLFPLTVGEVLGRFPSLEEFKSHLSVLPPSAPGAREAYEGLHRFGGFPEPFLRASETFYGRWSQERKTLLIREDIRDATRLREMSLLETLSHLVPGRVGAPLSINALKEDVGVAFETVREWLQVLESFYFLFRISPYSGSLRRTLRKESKVYLYDPVEAPEGGARFENTVALHLHKAAHLWTALGQGPVTLHYVRDKEKREVDFLLAERGRPLLMVECKTTDESPAPALVHFQERLNVPTAVQLVRTPGISRKLMRRGRTVWVVSADRWLSLLP